MPDYAATLSRIESKIAEARQDIALSPGERDVRVFSYRFQALSLTGDLQGCAQLGREMESVNSHAADGSDMLLLRAAVAIKLHRLADADKLLRADTTILSSAPGRLLQSDLFVQHGLYDEAAERIQSAMADDPTWDAYSRLAYLTALRGNIAEANRLYAQAQDELTAKQMHLFAWLDLQRGFMFFERGQYERARAHYLRADPAFPGYWLTAERIAELNGVQGRFYGAIGAYKRLYDATPKPEWAHAIGDLFALSGSQREALAWLLKALEGYTATVDCGEVYHFHYLVDLCCEIPGHVPQAVSYAHRDAALRSNHATEGDLAWALYRSGDTVEATMWIAKALHHGIVSSRLYIQAACVYASAGETALSAELMQKAKQVNPSPPLAKLRINAKHTRWNVVRVSSPAIELTGQ